MTYDIDGFFNLSTAPRVKTTAIGFCGKAESGKTEAAGAASRLFNIPVLSIADPIKDMCATVAREMFGYNYTKDQVRWLYQIVGSKGREIHQDYWINRLWERARGQKYILIDDVRYENEAESIRDRGGYVISVVRSGHINNLSEEERNHESEMLREIPVDENIYNNGRLPFLYGLVAEVVGEVLEEFNARS